MSLKNKEKESSERTAEKHAKLRQSRSTICFSNHYQNEMYNRTLIKKKGFKADT